MTQDSTSSTPPTMRSRVHALGSRSCGVSTREAAEELGIDSRVAHGHLRALMSQGLLLKGVKDGVRDPRYFSRGADRSNWVGHLIGLGLAGGLGGNLVDIGGRTAADKKAPNVTTPLLPGSLDVDGIPLKHKRKGERAAPVGESVNPRGVKPKVLPGWTHDSRYQVAPSEKPFGAGFSAVGIGRDIQTGKEWQ